MTKTVSLDNKLIAYEDRHLFLVQIGRGKGKYQNHNRVQGDLPHAVMLYNMLNIGNGYKKRLVCNDFNKPVIAKYISPRPQTIRNPFEAQPHKLHNV